jgi:flagellar hook-length control protein FliK
MTASLPFSQASFQSRTPYISKGFMKSPLQNRSAMSKSYAQPSADTRASFLDTFEQISKCPKQNQQTRGVHRTKTSLSSGNNPGEKFDGTSDPTDTVSETGIPETTKQRAENPENPARPNPPDLDSAAILSIIEKMGLYDSAGGSSNADQTDGIPGTAGISADLSIFFDRLEQVDFRRASEMRDDLYRLHQIFTDTQTDNASSNNDKNSLDRPDPNRPTEIAYLSQLLNRIALNQENNGSRSWVHVEGSDSNEKPSDKLIEMNRVTTGLPNSIGQTESFRPAENSQSASRSEVMEKTDAIRVAMERRLVGVEASEPTKASSPQKTVRQEGSIATDKSDAHLQVNLLKGVPPTIYAGKRYDSESALQNFLNTESSTVIKNTNDAQASKVLETGQRYGGEPVQINLVQNESSPVSKMIHDAQLAKENHIRMETLGSDEFSGKITKVDAGSMDTGLLSSQNQIAEKAFEGTSLSRQSDTGPENVKTQALDQIVRKAVIYARNGQHEVKIDLKPEFLGHVRMQVTTENHQVTVKILTEFGFVKDMVENNIHQLKADLQQQGLMVDKLEVAVSNNTDEYKHPRGKFAQAKGRQRAAAHITPVSQEGEIPEKTGGTGIRDEGKITVDYFA